MTFAVPMPTAPTFGTVSVTSLTEKTVPTVSSFGGLARTSRQNLGELCELVFRLSKFGRVEAGQALGILDGSCQGLLGVLVDGLFELVQY